VTPSVLRKRRAGRGTRKGTLFAYVAGKSDRCVVPEKALNKHRKVGGRAGGKAADQGELHGRTHGPDTEQGSRVPGTSWSAWSTYIHTTRAKRATTGAKGRYTTNAVPIDISNGQPLSFRISRISSSTGGIDSP
jgi:hypothetical protein